MGGKRQGVVRTGVDERVLKKIKNKRGDEQREKTKGYELHDEWNGR